MDNKNIYNEGDFLSVSSCGDNTLCRLEQISPGHFAIINIENGNRYRDSIITREHLKIKARNF